MTDETIIGIDLGTTFSAVAHVNQHGKPEIISNRDGDRTMPSVIFFEDDGSPIVGREARNLALISPQRTVRFIKREMGNPSFRKTVDGKDYFPEDLSAMILRKLKDNAEEVLGREITKAVISVPAYFKDAQREATRQAGKIAGLEVLRIVNEPTAAALAYGVEKRPQRQTLLVYDFGGGTFDVTLMRIEDKEFSIVATDGDAKLGGRDIDERLVEFLAEEFQREHGIDLRVEAHTHQDLWDKAEQAKRDLSFRENLSVTLAEGEKVLRVDIDRERFKELIQDMVDLTAVCIQRVMNTAGVSWPEIDTILLAGGSSRIPAVREMIAQVSGKTAAQDMNPDECVAVGAAIQAVVAVNEIASARGHAEKRTLDGGFDLVISDVASHSLGVKAYTSDKSKFVNSIIIPRYSKVPCEKTRTYVTSEDNQPEVVVEILQGDDDDPRSPHVALVGKAGLKDLPPHKAGELVIKVTLRYDADGVIEVITEELTSGNSTRTTVMHKTGILSADILAEKEQALAKQKL